MTADLRDRLQAALGSSYTLERELGGGGMSRVFLATEAALDRSVVIKVLPPELAQAVSGSGELPSGFVFNQGLEKGAAQFARLEGCWYGDRSIFFNATTGGDAGAGQVWQYHIGRRELQLIFESPSTDVLNSPDNICVSPRGGLVLCEDGSGVQHVRGLTVIDEEVVH